MRYCGWGQAGIWTSIAVGVVSIFFCIVRAHVSMCVSNFNIVRHKYLAENYCLEEAYHRDKFKYWAAHCLLYSYFASFLPSKTALRFASALQFFQCWKPRPLYAPLPFENFKRDKKTLEKHSKLYATRKAKASVQPRFSLIILLSVF